jgi:pilus assembly protein CpaF
MPRKKSTSSSSTTKLEDVNREEIYRIISDNIETEPPVGERYESLLRNIVEASIDEHGVKLTKSDREMLVDEIFSYIASYGPIEDYFSDPQVSEIMVNGAGQIFIEKNGEMLLTDLEFDNNDQVRFAINHIINPMGRYVNNKHRLIDSRLPDGSRVNAVIPPVSPNGPCITIRRFLQDKLTVDQLVELGSLTTQIAEFLSICVQASLNIVVAGNTSSGKTTLLNNLTHYIPDWERIVTIEDSAELSLHQTHVVSLEAQPADYQGEGAVTVRDLVRNALRMRPDRIVVGEVRGGEALDMLQAMNTGHDGSLTTVHSNSPRDTLSRLETMSLMSGIDMPLSAIRKQIASALNLIVQLSRYPDGSRRVSHISEVIGMEGDIITMTDLYKFEPTGVDENRKIVGEFRASGLRPSFSQALNVAGLRLDHKLFSNH